MSVYSHSKLSCYEQCPQNYKLQYIDKVETEIEESIEAYLGVRVHETLEKLHTWMTHMNKITDEIQEFIDTRLNVKKWRRKEAVEEKLKKITNQKSMKNVIHCQVHGSYGQLHVSMYCDMKSAYEKMSHAGKNLIITSIDNEIVNRIVP